MRETILVQGKEPNLFVIFLLLKHLPQVLRLFFATQLANPKPAVFFGTIFLTFLSLPLLAIAGNSEARRDVFRSTRRILADEIEAVLGHEIGHFVNEQTEAFASGSTVEFPLNAPEGGKEPLMALMEGPIAVELKPDTLETVGNFDYDGQIDGPITAHPKFDHATGEMIFFGNQAKGQFSDWVRYNVADKDGNLIKNEFIKVPYASFVHDFFVTEKYVIFPIYPLAFNLENVLKGGVPMAWEPDKGTHFGVIPRDGTADDVTWHSMDPRWSFHMVNAWDEGDSIKIDICASNASASSTRRLRMLVGMRVSSVMSPFGIVDVAQGTYRAQ